MLGIYNSLAAEIYDIDKPIGHSFGDVEFYRDVLAAETGLILEPAVGTGRVLIPLLEAGLSVHGLESSDAMLSYCHKHLVQRNLTTEIFCGHMQDFSLPHRYGAVILPAGSFLLLDDPEQASAALKLFAAHLRSGGLLTLDLYLPNGDRVGKSKVTEWTRADGEVLTMTETLVERDFFHQRTLYYLRYERWRNGKLQESEMQRLPVRWYGIEEFALMLGKQGFSDITVCGDYKKGEEPVHAGQTLTFLARKA